MSKMSVVLSQAERKICNIKDNQGKTVLHHACLKQFLNIVEYLLESGADPTYSDFEGNTALHCAVTTPNNDEIINYLISHEAPINAINKQYFSPLSLSVDNGKNNYVKILLNNGAYTNNDIPLCSTPLYIAMVNKATELVELLLGKDKGIDINTTYQ